MQVQNNFDYELSTQFKYSHAAEGEVPAKKLNFVAPSNRNRLQCTKIKQLYNRALTDYQVKILTLIQDKPLPKREDVKDVEPVEEDGAKLILQVIFSADKVDANEIVELFKDLICESRICFIDGRQEMTHALYEKMALIDTDKAMGEYLNHFLVSSQS